MEWKLGEFEKALPVLGSKGLGCANCGTDYSDDSVFCRKCGAKRPEARSDDDKRRIRLFAVAIELMVADLLSHILYMALFTDSSLLVETYGNLLMSKYPVPIVSGLHSAVLILSNCASSSCAMRFLGLLLLVVLQCAFLITCRIRFYIMFCENSVPIGVFTAGTLILAAVSLEVRFRTAWQKMWFSRKLFYSCSFMATLAVQAFRDLPPQVLALSYGMAVGLAFLLDDILAQTIVVESWADGCTAVLHAHWRLCSILPRFLTYLFTEEVEKSAQPPAQPESVKAPSNTCDPEAPASTSFNMVASSSGEMPELPGLDVHYKVPPHKWCVTRSDVEQFVADVREAWLRGEIPDAEDPQFRNPYHNDPWIGPNMYQVNKHYIKPKTYANGGMSYALMLHPEGLPVDLFMTHAWAEGIFEFSSKLLRNWPKGAQNVWCCFLANPQNCDIGSLLGDDVLESPFAQAIREAKKMIAIPNCATSIYTRMWCVLEAKLGIENGLDIIIPTSASPFVMRRAATHGYICMASSVALSFAAINLLKRNVFWTFICMFLLTNTWCALAVFLNRASQRASGGGFFMVQEARMGLIGLLGGFLFHTFAIRDVHERVVIPMRPAGFAILALGPMINYRVLHHLRKAILEEEAQQLEFDTVLKAECTSEYDKEHILQAIHGEESSIDGMIRNLQAAGVYNARVREDIRLGFDPAHGYLFEWAKSFATLTIWSFCFAGNMISFPPPTYTGFMESQAIRLVDIQLYRVKKDQLRCDLEAWPMRARELLSFIVMCSVQIPLLCLSSALAQPRRRQAKFYVDMMWTSGCCFLISYCLMGEVVSYLWEAWELMPDYPHARTRRVSFFKDWGSLSAFAIAIVRVVLGPRALGRFSLFWRCIIRMAQIIYAGILLWLYRRSSASFETCVAACAYTDEEDIIESGCLQHCFWECSLPCFLVFVFGVVAAALLRVMKAPRKHIQKKAAEIEMGTLPRRRNKSRRFSPSHHMRISERNERRPSPRGYMNSASTLSSALSTPSSFSSPASPRDCAPARSEEKKFASFSTEAIWQLGFGSIAVFIAVMLGVTTPLPASSIPYETSKGVMQTLAMDFSRDGRYVLLAGVQDRAARLSTVSVQRTVQTFVGHESPVSAATLSADAKHVLTIDDYDSTAMLWNTSSGARARKIEIEGFERNAGWTFRSLSLSDDASRAFLCAKCANTHRTVWTLERIRIWVWDAHDDFNEAQGRERAKLVYEFESNLNPSGVGVPVALNAEISKILVGFPNGTVASLQRDSSARTAFTWRTFFVGHSDAITALAMTPDGSRFLSGSYDKTARLWDAPTGAVLYKIDLKSEVEAVAMSADGSVIAVVHRGSTDVYDLEKKASRARTSGPACSGAPLYMSGNGQSILSYCTHERQGMLWNLADSYKRKYFGDPLEHVYISANLRHTLVRWRNGGVVLKERNNIRTLMEENGQFIYTCMNYNGSLMLGTIYARPPHGRPFSCQEKRVRAVLFDMNTGEQLRSFKADIYQHTNRKLHILLGARGEWAVTYTRSSDWNLDREPPGTVTVWNVTNGEVFGNFTVLGLTRVQIGHYRNYIVTGSEDGKLQLYEYVYETRTWRMQEGFKEYRRSKVTGMEFSLHDSRLLTTTDDGSLQMWNAEDGSLLRDRNATFDCYFRKSSQWKPHGVGAHSCDVGRRYQIISMTISPDGHFILLAKRSMFDASIQIELISERGGDQLWQHFFGPDTHAATWVKFDSSGDHWYLFSNFGQLTMWDTISQDQTPRKSWYVLEAQSWAYGW